MGMRMGILVALVVTVLTVSATVPWTAEALQFSVMHKYAHLEGSPANRGGQGMTPEYFATLLAHDSRRRRLIAAVGIPLGSSPSLTLYYMQVSVGTPPRQFHVHVDTGSNIFWLNCAPCQGCPPYTTLPGITLQKYSRLRSSTDAVLGCNSADCRVNSRLPSPCDNSGACSFVVLYGGGDQVSGILLRDVLTFQQAATTTTANIYFGCGTNLLKSDDPKGALDGLIGFGKDAVAVTSQLADKGLTERVFAHCLQGDRQIGGGTFVIGNILEPGIVYTPLVSGKSLYNVGLQNIAVDGVKITTPASFVITPGLNDGVIVDSGTSHAYLPEPAYTDFVTAIITAVSGSFPSGSTLCWLDSGNIASSFPPVTLFFDGDAVMNLAPANYLVPYVASSGATYECLAWHSSETLPVAITILGDVVLKDLLVVYDNELERLGWKPFDCTQAITVGS